LFKIRTLPTLTPGDEVENTANIFFDYNAAIDTNEAKTSFESLRIPGLDIDQSIVVYPNPTKNYINIKCISNIKSVEVFDVQGRILRSVEVSSNEYNLNLTSQSNGMYFIKIITEDGSKVEKVMKE
jgi:hypothetical protein